MNRQLLWSSAWGRSWYGPLRYVGPIEVAVQARPWVLVDSIPGPRYEPLPLLVEIRTDPRAAQCQSDVGGMSRSTFGTTSCDPDSLWTVFPITELPLPLNSEYWIQTLGLLVLYPERASSPFVGCVRVTAFPSSIAEATWGRVKRLYQ